MNRTFGAEYDTTAIQAKKSGTAPRVESMHEPFDPVQFGFDISASN